MLPTPAELEKTTMKELKKTRENCDHNESTQEKRALAALSLIVNLTGPNGAQQLRAAKMIGRYAVLTDHPPAELAKHAAENCVIIHE